MKMNSTPLARDEQDLPSLSLHWKDLFDAIPHPTMVLDRDHRIVTVNQATLELLDLQIDEIIGERCYELFHQAQVPFIGCPMEAGRAEGSSKPGDVEIEVKGRTYLVTCTPVLDATGTATRFVHIATDITRQKQVELAEHELTQRYRLLSEQLPCSIWSTDRDLRYTSSTGVGLREVGLEPDQLLGMTIGEFYAGLPEREEILVAYHRALMGEKQAYESRYRGRIFIAHIEPLHNEKNEIVGTLGIAYDITEEKQMQSLLEQINRKHTLLNSITQHDARNKITSLMAYLTLLKDEVREPGVRENLEKISSIVDDLAELFEFTRTYQNLGLKSPQWEDIAFLISKLPAGPIRLIDHVDGLKIMADPMLENVFFNLLDNAVRHGGHMSTITISASEKGNELVLTWEDDGVGIPEGDKGRIFDRGFGKNTGLGLFLIREILSITGMTIQETGTPGSGARFEITVPKGAYTFTPVPEPKV